MGSAQQLLDQVQSPARIAALVANPAAYADLVRAELPEAATLAELEVRDAAWRTALGRIDPMIERAMRIHMDHDAGVERAIAVPTRKVFASTIVSYAGRISLLEQRVRDVVARGGGAVDPDAIARMVGEAAEAVLALHAALSGGVLELVRAAAAAGVAPADAHARDRRLDEPARRKWSAARRDLEAIAADPARVLAAAWAARIAALPDQLDEPDPAAEPTFADLLELD